MLRLLSFHASYCTLHLMHCTILLLPHMALLPARPHIRDQVEQVQMEYGGHQVSSRRILTLLLNKASLGASHQHSSFIE
jgi:hypothetical protein